MSTPLNPTFSPDGRFFWNGSTWVPVPGQLPPAQPMMAQYGYSPMQGRDGAQYVRQQQRHSIITHAILAMCTGGLSLFVTFYYMTSPNHYFSA